MLLKLGIFTVMTERIRLKTENCDCKLPNETPQITW